MPFMNFFAIHVFEKGLQLPQMMIHSSVKHWSYDHILCKKNLKNLTYVMVELYVPSDLLKSKRPGQIK